MPMIEKHGLTLVGIAVGNLDDDELPAAGTALRRTRAPKALDSALDGVRDRFGSAAVTRAVLLGRRQGIDAGAAGLSSLLLRLVAAALSVPRGMVRAMTKLQSGVVISAGTPREFADLAVAAEKAGWDAIFTFEGVWGQDAWVTLTAAAMVTEKIRVGTMLTPIARNRPWELAGKVATLDNLSGGRVQLAVGMGALHPGWLAFEADEGRKVRAEKLDEGLAIYDGLMHGQPFSFSGKHYQVTPTDFLTPPPQVQQPRVPVWVVGAYPSVEVAGPGREVGRAALHQGRIRRRHPLRAGRSGGRGGGGPAAAGGGRSAVGGVRRGGRGGQRPGRPGMSRSAEWVDAGATWWVESDWSMGEDAVARHRARIDAGPPAP